MFSKLLQKEFSLWVVSPSSGSVHKCNLQATKIIAGVALILFLSFTFLFIAGDYGRVQILRAYNHFRANRLDSEIHKLLQTNNTLKSKLSGLENDLAKSGNFETDIRLKLAELSSVLDKAKKLGVLPKTGSKPATAIGGAEVDCVLDKQGKCLKLPSKSEIAHYKPSSFNSLKKQTNVNSSLLDDLNDKIEAIKLIPMGSPVLGKISSGYGYRKSPFSGRIKLHQGVDFSLPYGSKIFSTAYGRVIAVKRTGTYGLSVDIEHSKGIVTRYAHLSKVTIQKGQTLQRGQQIGQVGSSGRSTGPHLHYEVLVNGRSINPYELIFINRELSNIA